MFRLPNMAVSICLAAGLLIPTTSAADEAGEIEYKSTCANCHGDNGAGDGPLAGFMNTPVPDLTMLSASNDGVFPMLEVIQTIDGRSGVRGHGTEMPLWGEHFKSRSESMAGEYGAELIVRGRVLSLAYYLASIQQ